MMPTAPSSVVCGYNVVDRPRPRAADDDLSVNHGGVLVMSAADVSLSLIAVTQPTTFELKLPLEVRQSSSSFFIDPAPRRCSRSS